MASQTPPRSLGQELKEAREAAGLSAQDVAARLNLRLQVIHDIESDNVEQHISDLFYKGYVRSYAKLLNISESQILAEYNLTHEPIKPVKMHTFSQPILDERTRDGRLKWLTWLIILILLVLLGWWWWQNHSLTSMLPQSLTHSSLNISKDLQQADSTAKTQNASEKSGAKQKLQLPTAAMPSPPANAAKEAEKVAAELTHINKASSKNNTGAVSTQSTKADINTASLAASVDSMNLSAQKSVTPSTSSAQTAKKQPLTADQLAHQLTITFSKACWIEVRDAAGNRLAVGIKQPGQVLKLNGQPPYKLVLGVPDGVDIRYGGKPVLFKASGSGLTARITVPN
ncbi:MAG: Cytoskeleton protein RodZ [Candidatus Celerinatantimonas neptuna]|nr:MAG: Cytoskeleton protein RodZ [Candidatus Celerinatantimonas neptuna]